MLIVRQVSIYVDKSVHTSSAKREMKTSQSISKLKLSLIWEWDLSASDEKIKVQHIESLTELSN